MSFNLADVLKDVPNLDTPREQITYIRRDLLDSDTKNFYQLSGIEELAANIELCGLQQPIRVRLEDTGRYSIVSGHRRNAAVDLLAKDAPERWQEVACIVEQDAVSPALRQLRLIYANANNRNMTSAELGEQAAQVEKLLYQLKEDGYEFPGRMRDHVAQAVNVSKSKLARLKVIRDGLDEAWEPLYKKGTVSESTAYELARLSPDDQQLIYIVRNSCGADPRYMYADDVKEYADRLEKVSKLTCRKCGGGACQNIGRKRDKVLRIGRYFSIECDKCCEKCENLASCKNACPLLADKIKQLKDEKREERRQEKEAEEKKERPVIEYIRGVYDRVGKARQSAGVTVAQLYKAQDVYYAITDEEKQKALESGTAKISTDTTLPFGYSFYSGRADKLCAVADLLHCSIDYLLGRTDDPSATVAPIVPNSGTWRTGTPEEYGDYAVMVLFDPDGEPSLSALSWGGEWYDGTISIKDLGFKVLCWTPMPEIPREESFLNNSCITGMSSTGHCGAAAFCDKPHMCCLQCSDPCNSRCGWLAAEENVPESDTTEE